MGSIGSKGKKCPKGCYPVPQQQKACPTAYPPMMRPQAPPITQQYHMPQMQMPQVSMPQIRLPMQQQMPCQQPNRQMQCPQPMQYARPVQQPIQCPQPPPQAIQYTRPVPQPLQCPQSVPQQIQYTNPPPQAIQYSQSAPQQIQCHQQTFQPRQNPCPSQTTQQFAHQPVYRNSEARIQCPPGCVENKSYSRASSSRSSRRH